MRSPQDISHYGVSLSALPILALLLCAAPTSALQVGEVAPEFVVRPLQGGAFGFVDATRTHAAVVVVFLSVVCPYANSHEQHLKDLELRFEPRGVLFVEIYSNRTEMA